MIDYVGLGWFDYEFWHDDPEEYTGVVIACDYDEQSMVYSFSVLEEELNNPRLREHMKNMLYEIPDYFLKRRKEDTWQLKLF